MPTEDKRTRAELLAVIGGLEADLATAATPNDEAVDTLKELTQSLETDLKAAQEQIATLEADAQSAGSSDELMSQATERLEMQDLAIQGLKAKLAESERKGTGAYGAMEALAEKLDVGGEHRVSDDMARMASQSPWLHVETINFRMDSGYDANAKDRAVASVQRAFDPSRLGIVKGEYTGLPPFNPGNKLVVAVAIVPTEA